MLAVPTALIGLQMPALGYGICSSKVYSTLFAITVVLNVIVEITLEVIGYKIGKNVKSNCEDSDFIYYYIYISCAVNFKHSS